MTNYTNYMHTRAFVGQWVLWFFMLYTTKFRSIMYQIFGSQKNFIGRWSALTTWKCRIVLLIDFISAVDPVDNCYPLVILNHQVKLLCVFKLVVNAGLPSKKFFWEPNIWYMIDQNLAVQSMQNRKTLINQYGGGLREITLQGQEMLRFVQNSLRPLFYSSLRRRSKPTF